MEDIRIKQGINKVLELFKNGDPVKTIALLTNPLNNTPSSKWSLRNKMLMFLQGTSDARSFNQWKEVKRNVKKGEKAIYILSPCMKKNIKNNGKEELKLYGFKPTAVFKLDSTEGEPIIYEDIPNKFYDLQDVAIKWDIEVKQDYFNGGVYGFYSKEVINNNDKKIIMASPEELVFYHELAHAGHDKIGLLSKRNKQQKEIVAEFVACVLCEMRNRSQDKVLSGIDYIKHYAGNEKIEDAIFKLIRDIEKVLKIILNTAEESNQNIIV